MQDLVVFQLFFGEDWAVGLHDGLHAEDGHAVAGTAGAGDGDCTSGAAQGDTCTGELLLRSTLCLGISTFRGGGINSTTVGGYHSATDGRIGI